MALLFASANDKFFKVRDGVPDFTVLRGINETFVYELSPHRTKSFIILPQTFTDFFCFR